MMTVLTLISVPMWIAFFILAAQLYDELRNDSLNNSRKTKLNNERGDCCDNKGSN